MKVLSTALFLALVPKTSHGFHVIRPTVARAQSNSVKSILFSTNVLTAEQVEYEGLVVGDTKGAVLLLEDVAISRGSSQIINKAEIRVEKGQRWGIVGPNGAGNLCTACNL